MVPHWSARQDATGSGHSCLPVAAEPYTEPGMEDRLQIQVKRYKGERTQESPTLPHVRIHLSVMKTFPGLVSLTSPLYPPLLFSTALISLLY